jgi:release factor glutamine methyltransferase
VRVIATDLSDAALDVARANARGAWGREPRRVRSHLAPAALDSPLDMIVSNPPYVRERDRASLAPDVRDFEPAQALFAGDDGLDVLRALVQAAAGALRPGGWLVTEMGDGQAAGRGMIKQTSGLVLGHVRPDLRELRGWSSRLAAIRRFRNPEREPGTC